MTTLRDAAIRALEAFDGLSEDAVCQSSHHAKKDQHTSLDVCPVFLRLRAVITALRAALAEPVQEPQRKPLTDDQITAINASLKIGTTTELVRAVERAHGIGGDGGGVA